MITRCKPPALSRSIASSAALPPFAFKSLARAYEDKEKVTEKSQDKPTNDPWAPIFDDIASTAPPVPSPRSQLPPRFFNSRPAPKTFFSSNTTHRHPPSGSGRREYGTDAKGAGSSFRPGSNGDSHRNLDTRSTWDHVFEGIDGEPSGSSSSSAPRPHTLGANITSSAFPTSSARRPTRRPSMTAREISAFDDMFDMIFTAVSKSRVPDGEAGNNLAAAHVPSSSPSSTTTSPPPAPEPEPTTPTPPQSIGRSPSGKVFDLFGKLRRQSNRMRRTSATDELLDRQKEEMELCDTDQELLDWALREVFPENPTSSGLGSASELARYLATPTYPHVLAHLMGTFRTKYRDPHAALALFAHAKRRSILSYVFGCTTPAYNELLETKWELNGALKDVEDALAEMRANGVSVDKRTRAFVERIRREVGERMLGRKAADADGDVWDALERVEALVQKKGQRGSRADTGKESRFDAKKRHWNEEWKTANTADLRLGEDRLSLRA